MCIRDSRASVLSRPCTHLSSEHSWIDPCADRMAHYTLFSGALSECQLADQAMEFILGYTLMQPQQASECDSLRRSESCPVGEEPVWVRTEGIELEEVVDMIAQASDQCIERITQLPDSTLSRSGVCAVMLASSPNLLAPLWSAAGESNARKMAILEAIVVCSTNVQCEEKVWVPSECGFYCFDPSDEMEEWLLDVERCTDLVLAVPDTLFADLAATIAVPKPAGSFIAAASEAIAAVVCNCLLYTSPSPRDRTRSRMPSSA
eukprot:TRINITY_DN23300_c0_g1_i1.p1 TRINITY_DN23300_c0_g1~~TRINITY_DN23300_c0_g1_i1.p1  ORF type:complete len:262 (-),score=103.87 TRINITY_DN23300_c0_g1_i1:92-877(-)